MIGALLVAALEITPPPQLLDAIDAADRQADAAVAALASPAELAARQADWRRAWLDGLGGLPAERTPLNARVGSVTRCDGFTLQNVLFESLPGVYVVGHLALPDAPQFVPPYPAVLMPNGHADEAILAPRYAHHLAMMARAGFAAFSWDPISQGERRQSPPRFDYTDNCSTEHTRLGARGWLVGWNFARFLIWDGMRALDYLETRRDIDCSRVGVCGTSGGGTQSAYLQALDSRIRVAFPNCFISSIRAVFRERGCHDAEQFFWNQLTYGVNHAAILAMGAPRVALATGSRWDDYFPHVGAVETFAVYSNLVMRLDGPSSPPMWHFHCAGPHGLPLPTRTAQVDWMRHCLAPMAPPNRGESALVTAGLPALRPLTTYWGLSKGDHSGTNDPATSISLPFTREATFFTASHHVRDLKDFRSLFDLIADRARDLARVRATRRSRDGKGAVTSNLHHRADSLREIVRRRAGIRPLDVLRREGLRPAFDHPTFGWWYLKGAFGCRRENEAAMLSTLGQSVVGREAESLILAASRKPPETLVASGWRCIAAAHAYAAEPQLFTGVAFTNPPPSWTQLVTSPDPVNDSFAIAVWGALEDYDWPDLVTPNHGL